MTAFLFIFKPKIMKKIVLFIAIHAILASCKPTTNEAVKYNDSIIEIIDAVTKAQNNFLLQVDGHNSDSLKITHTLFVNVTANALSKASKLESFDKSTTFADAAKSYVNEINFLANIEAKKLVELIAQDSTDFSEEQAAEIKKTAETYDAKYNIAYTKINEAQKVFSKKYGFMLLNKE